MASLEETQAISIGRQGENEVRILTFDLTEFITEYGDGTPVLIHQRSGDTRPYICTTTFSDSILSWTVTDADTHYSGFGKAEIRWVVGEALKKSAIFKTYCDASIMDEDTEQPGEIVYMCNATEEIVAAQEAAVQAVEDKGAETLASIPEDYTDLSNQVASLNEDLYALPTAGYEAMPTDGWESGLTISGSNGTATSSTTFSANRTFLRVPTWCHAIKIRSESIRGYVALYKSTGNDGKDGFTRRLAFTANEVTTIAVKSGEVYARICYADTDATLYTTISIMHIFNTDTTEVHHSGLGWMLDVAETYLAQADNFEYLSQCNLFANKYIDDATGKYCMTCSGLVEAILHGIKFEGSRYVGAGNVQLENGFSSDGTGYYAGVEADNPDSYTEYNAIENCDYMLAGGLLKYFDEHGMAIKFNKDSAEKPTRNDFRPGDIIFYVDDDSAESSSPSHYKKTSHTALCLYPSDTYYYLLESNNNDAVKTLMRTYTEKTWGDIRYYVHCPVSGEHTTTIAYQWEKAVSAPTAYTTSSYQVLYHDFTTPLGQGFYTVVIEDSGNSKYGEIWIEYIDGETIPDARKLRRAFCYGKSKIIFYAEQPVTNLSFRLRRDTSSTESATADTMKITVYRGYYGDKDETGPAGPSYDDTEVRGLIADNTRDLNYLWKLNKGISYEFEADSTEAYEKTVPSGAKVVTIQSIGGHSEVVDSEIVSADVDEVQVKGVNLWDEQWEVGTIAANQVSPKDFIEVEPDTNYAIISSSSTYTGCTVYYYDEEKTAISNAWVMTFTTPSGCRYIKFRLPSSYGTTYNYDIAVIKGSSGTYSAYRDPVDLPVPDAIRALPGYGWSAGSVCNEVDYENKVYIQRVGSVDLGTLNWSSATSYSGLDGHYRYNAAIPAMSTENNLVRWLSVIGNAHRDDIINNGATGLAYSIASDTTIRYETTEYTTVADCNTAMSGVYLYYELATPTETDITDLLTDAAIAEPVEVEAGGTVTIHNDNLLETPNTEEYLISLAEVEV